MLLQDPKKVDCSRNRSLLAVFIGLGITWIVIFRITVKLKMYLNGFLI